MYKSELWAWASGIGSANGSYCTNIDASSGLYLMGTPYCASGLGWPAVKRVALVSL